MFKYVHLKNKQKGESVGKSAKSLADMVASRMLEDILTGKLSPGERLPESKLAEKHTVSRATVREALAQLEKKHFVERLPRYGARVAEINFSEIQELYELRSVLLGLAAKRAAKLANEKQLQNIKNKAKHLKKLAKKNDNPLIYTKAALTLQAQVIGLSGSKWVQNMYEQIASHALWHTLIRNNGVVFSTKERRQKSAQHWNQLTDAISKRNITLAEKTAQKLITASAKHITEQYVLNETKTTGL